MIAQIALTNRGDRMSTKRKAVKIAKSYHKCEESGGFLMVINLDRENAILLATKILDKIGWDTETRGVILKPRIDDNLTVQTWK